MRPQATQLDEYALVEPRVLLRSVFIWVRMSIFDKFSLKENWRIMSLKHLEKIKGR
jgi:hypothetical protein